MSPCSLSYTSYNLKKPRKHFVAVTLIISLIIAVICVFEYSTVYLFLQKYFIVPIVADAQAETGVSEGEYNIFNTLAYGALLAVSLFLVYKLLKKFALKIDVNFFIALLPFIILGSVLRVLEDMRFFSLPFEYLFISPIIYIFVGMIVIGIVVFSAFINKKFVNSILFITGIILLAIATIPCSLTHWRHPDALVIIIGLSALATACVFLIFRVLSVKIPTLKAYLSFSSLALFGAHFLDASATFAGIDFYHYAEKHPLPIAAIGIFGSAWIMYVLKFIVVFLVIYLLDIEYSSQLSENAKWLVKICVFILGAAPGIRDLLRIGLGV